MDTQLWRWNEIVQVCTALLLTLFFLVLMRTTRRSGLSIWVFAWLAHFAALVIAVLFAITPHVVLAAPAGARLAYLALECLFVVLLSIGAAHLARTPFLRLELSRVLLAVLVYSLVLGMVAQTPDMLEVLMSVTGAQVLLSAAGFLMMRGSSSFGWLAAGLALRGLLALGAAVAHGARILSNGVPTDTTVDMFLSMSAALDAGAEWLIALGGVLAIYDTVGRELSRINRDLEATKDELRILSYRDPLTGVLNRRRLPGILSDSRLTGATILFFDLDDFKDINDVHGHHVGDEALCRFARGLTSSFRPEDHVIRYAGDEFLVVGQAIEEVDVHERIETLREHLTREHIDGLHIHFAVGEAYLPIGGDPEAAIRDADAAMYRRKGEQKQRRA
jgi:diguanylate cyclase (GGDEF)-like protein